MHPRKYTQFITIGFKEAAAYRMNALMGLANSILYLVMAYAIWAAIAANGSLQGGLQNVLVYLVLGQVTSRIAFQSVEQQIGDSIREGTIVNELKRPISLRGQIYTSLIGKALFGAATVGVPMLGAGILFFGVPVPTPAQFAAYIVSLFLAFNVVFMLSFATAMLIFWTKVPWGVRVMRSTIQDLFSGVLFPLYLMPASLAGIIQYLPFRAMADIPITIFRGEITGIALLEAFGIQLAWIVVLFVVGELAWNHAKSKLTVQGG